MSYDAVIVGAGILGSSVAYFASENGLKVAVIEKEKEPGIHSTYRNTGVVHRPFYLNPLKRKASAFAASRSYPFLKKFVEENGLYWNQLGTLEVATDPEGAKVIGDYERWARENGMEEDEFQILDDKGIISEEPNVRGKLAFLSMTDSVVNFKQISEKMIEVSESKGTSVFYGCRTESVSSDGEVSCSCNGSEKKISGKAVVVAAGGETFNLATKNGLKGYAQLHFRGDYWKLSEEKGKLFRRNIYTVPRFPNFPFLDPHIIKRHTGGTEIGPNAFLVPGPYDYQGTLSKILKNAFGSGEGPFSVKARLFRDAEFMRLVFADWKISLFKSSLMRKVSEFAVGITEADALGKGISGIRHNIIDERGFLSEPFFYINGRALFVLNYNSPGATGSPWYASVILTALKNRGLLQAIYGNLVINDESEALAVKALG
ncbi:MAG: NAD(P)/FAD-dependent oxidoreductase [Nitrososphaeria archaeon]